MTNQPTKNSAGETGTKPGILGILITGASRGIGLEMARQYAERDWRVYACCRHPEQATELRRAAETAAGRLSLHALDVTDAAAAARLAGELKGRPIDMLVNNAGIYSTAERSVDEVDEKAWVDVLRTNTIAPFLVSRALLPHVTAGTRKVIATISSGMGSIADNEMGGYYSYRSSKAAVNMVMKGLSLELRDRGIICVALSPGWVRTDMGGASAPLSPKQSVEGLSRVLDRLTPADSGKFLSYDGKEVDW